MEEGRQAGTLVCYVARVMAVEEDRRLTLSFLRLKDSPLKDTYSFPTIDDIDQYEVGKVKGVLSVSPGATKRQANLIKIFPPPLVAFNMR